MIIRKFREYDALGVCSLIKKTMVEVNIKDYSLNILEAESGAKNPHIILRSFIKNGEYYVVIENNRIIGFGGFSDNEIKLLFVCPEYHKRGIGKQIMNKIEQEAVEKNIEFLLVNSSLSAEGFYKKLGYKTLERKRVTLNKDMEYPVILMRKRLI